MRKIITSILIFAILITSCESPNPTLNKIDDSEDIPTATSHPTETSDVMITPILKSTQQPTITITNTPHVIEAKPSMTTFPEFYTALEYIAFLETISCDDPCFWGLEPGKSNAEDVINTFQPLELFSDVDIRISGSDDFVGFKLIIPDEDFYYSVNAMFESGIVTKIKVVISNREDPTEDRRSRPGEDNEISEIYLHKVRTYQPLNLYPNWSLPKEVFIRTFIPAPEPQNWPTQTFIYYPLKGYLLTYINPTYYLDQENSNYVCILDNPELILWLFEPEKNLLIEDILELINPDFVYELDMVTEINTEEFMELYTDGIDCLNKYVIIPRSDDYEWAPHYIQP